MRNNNTYIDKIVDKSIKSFLVTESYFDDFKNRVHNGLNGFNCGYDFQKNLDRYADNDYNDLIEDISNLVEELEPYINYFEESKDKVKYFEETYYQLEHFTNLLMIVVNAFKETNGLHESFVNRAKGFVNGFANNQNSERGIGVKTFQLLEKLEYFYNSNLLPRYTILLKTIEKLNKEYGKDENFANILVNLNEILTEVIDLIKDNLYTDREEEFGDTVKQKLDKLVSFGGKNFENNGDTTLTPYVNKITNYIKGKLKNNLNNSTYKKIENYAKE